MTGRTNQNIVLAHKLCNVTVVACAVLQRHDQRVAADHRQILPDGILREDTLHKDDHQILHTNVCPTLHGFKGVSFLRAISFLHNDAVLVDVIDQRLVHIYHRYVLCMGQLCAIQTAHCACTQYCDFHIPRAPSFIFLSLIAVFQCTFDSLIVSVCKRKSHSGKFSYKSKLFRMAYIQAVSYFCKISAAA